MMKTICIISLALIVILSLSCSKEEVKKDQSFVFSKPYCATVTVGGFVGLAEKCFKIGDTVVGQELNVGKITIRIAPHSDRNDGPGNSESIQEFLDVPSDYLMAIKQ